MKTVKLLEGHAMHDDDPASEYVPLPHAEHVVEATDAENDPAVQLVQLVPVMREPAGQGMHSDERMKNPALHWYGQFVALVPTPV